MERYRPYPDLTDCPPPTDTAEIIETELSITRAERHAAVLARLTEIGSTGAGRGPRSSR